MGRTMLLLAATAMLAGCYPYRWSTALEPTGPGTYKFNAGASTIDHPADDPSAEAERLALLKDAMNTNGFCPSGYAITDRQAVLGGRGLIADAWRVNYFIRCNA
ncbi:MAG: hypothetical protein ACRC67_03870 [Inquilinus sp.]|uniref:hypothetical protein n=1 Tax=Inquilinus sp. TaxID=1932117 RepID=UPI003F3EBAE9